MIERTHPEGTCDQCGGPNIVWGSPIWVAVVGSENGVLCPLCFADTAERMGHAPLGWTLTPRELDS